MHLYLFVRGKFEQIELWKVHAQSAYWKLRRINNKTGKEEIGLVQGALRPSIFGAYEYVFPKEALAEVCAFFGIDGHHWGKNKTFSKARHLAMRQIFGCRNIPHSVLKKAKTINPNFSVNEWERGVGDCKIPGVIVHQIGIKDDVVGEMAGYTYELI